MDAKRLGLFIKTLRKEKELTQEQLAEELFVSSKTVSRWETGNVLPDVAMLQTIADYFGVDIRELLNGERSDVDSEQKEMMRKLAEYTEKKERKGLRKTWIIAAVLLAAAGAVTALVLVLSRASSRTLPDRENSGYGKPLSELKENYSALQAEYDGLVVFEGSEILHGELRWKEFLRKVHAKEPAQIRIYQLYPASEVSYYVKHLVYDGDRFHLSYYDRTGDTKQWFFVEDSYRYLNENDTYRYDYHSRTYLLADDPGVTYEEYMQQMLLSAAPAIKDPRFDHVHSFARWDVSQKTAAPERPMYGVGYGDNDGVDGEEKYFLGMGITSGVFTFTLKGFTADGRLLGSHVYRTEWMELSLEKAEDGRLYVVGKREGQEIHRYLIVPKEGRLLLKEGEEILYPMVDYELEEGSGSGSADVPGSEPPAG